MGEECCHHKTFVRQLLVSNLENCTIKLCTKTNFRMVGSSGHAHNKVARQGEPVHCRCSRGCPIALHWWVVARMGGKRGIE
jgi:hypothetical protein